MKKYKHKSLFLIFIFLIISVLSFTQSSSIILEYSPNLGSFINLNVPDTQSKLSHNISLKLDFLLSDTWSLSGGIGYYNIGYKFDPESTAMPPSGNLTFINNIDIINHNYLVLSTGHRVQFKKYFIAPDIGAGFSLERSITRISKNEQGDKSRTKSRTKPEKVKFSMIPVSLSIGKEIELFRLNAIVGIKGYYSFFTEELEKDKGIKVFGVGLLFGVKLD